MTLLWAVLLLPLLGSTGTILLKSRLPRRTIGIWASSMIVLAFFASIGIDVKLASLPAAARVWTPAIAPFVTGFGPAVWWRFYIDPLSSVWLLIITGVGALIHIYSVGYMEGERDESTYFAYLNFFIFAMELLVLAGNLVILLIGWALVGLASYW
ncbi:MAG: NADH-quinone oxidoreductase subunit L, partial [Firmicutes bacterium]|nr:NADH-quinone oxidoreductase subunit L [Bacillota bacterium]